MKILVLNGPNLNMLGIREPAIYGKQTFADLITLIQDTALAEELEIEQFQSNHEGDLVDKIQAAYGIFDGIPAVEVHISDVDSREPFRKISYAGMACVKTIKGQGFDGYRQAILYLKDNFSK